MTFFANTHFRIGLTLCLVVVLMAALSLVWTPYDGTVMRPADRLQGPSLRHPMGTDQYGRDLFSRIMGGSVTSILAGLVTVSIGMGLGVALGLAAAYHRGVPGEALMRLADLLFAFPAVLTAILITTIWGPSLTNAMLAIGIFYIPVFARLTRATAAAIWERDFIIAARAAGMGEVRIVIDHILPNILSPLLVQATIQFAVAILAEAGLSYLGLGTQPPAASWGRMLGEAQTFMAMAPWMAVCPGLAIAWTVLGLNLLGDGLRDTLDPRMAAERHT
ncbi:MAG: ABC transporter permease [Desulfosarcinaceae bacterium]|nr:ABC transporter permease [Desulfosarcinaceae bacterium]